MAEKVVFEKREGWGGRYRVETKEVDGWWESSWSIDKYFEKKSSAIARAENILGKRRVGEVRVVDTMADEEVKS